MVWAKANGPFPFTFYISFRMQKDQPASSLLADRFASQTTYRKSAITTNLFCHGANKSLLFVSGSVKIRNAERYQELLANIKLTKIELLVFVFS